MGRCRACERAPRAEPTVVDVDGGEREVSWRRGVAQMDNLFLPFPRTRVSLDAAVSPALSYHTRLSPHDDRWRGGNVRLLRASESTFCLQERSRDIPDKHPRPPNPSDLHVARAGESASGAASRARSVCAPVSTGNMEDAGNKQEGEKERRTPSRQRRIADWPSLEQAQRLQRYVEGCGALQISRWAERKAREGYDSETPLHFTSFVTSRQGVAAPGWAPRGHEQYATGRFCPAARQEEQERGPCAADGAFG